MEIDVKITRLGTPDSNVKAYVSATIGNCFAVRGMKLVEGKNGLFLSMPNYQKRDGSYTDVCFPTTAEFRQRLNNAAVAAYQLCLEKQLGQAQSNDGSAPEMGMSM
ncbi:MAG: SpoVG family protein [Oscillospiraceae bacterium]